MKERIVSGNDDIVFTEGVLERNGVAIGVTKGGAKFKAERTFKEIAFDNQKGPVKGFHRPTKEVATLEVSMLQFIGGLNNYHAGIDVDTSVEGEVSYAAGDEVKAEDYQDTAFIGRTKNGKIFKVLLKNAINLESIEWDLMVDADEIVDKVTFTATMDNPDSKEKMWKVSIVEKPIV